MKKKIYALLLLLSSSAFSAELSLQDALKQAEKSNNTIMQKKLESENADLDLKNSKISKLPTFDWSSSANKAEDTDSFTHSVSIKQSLYTGNAITNQIEKSELEQEKANLELQSEIESVKLEVVSYYMNALKYQNQIEIYSSSLEELEEQYKQQKVLYANKFLAKNELLELEAEIIETESSLIEVENNYKVQLEKLKNSIQYTGNDITLKMPNVSTDEIDYSSDSEELKENNIDIKIGELNEKILAESVEIQKADYLPDLDFNFSYSSSDEELADSLGEWEWKAGVSLSYELFDWGETKNEVKQAQNSYEIQKLSKKDDIDEAVLELKTKYYELEKLEKQIDAQNKLVEARNEKYKLDVIRYENRYLDTESYLSSKNDVITSKLELVNLNTEYYIAYNEYLNIIK